MGISIKNERVEAEIRLLADKLGVGLTEAVEAGVRAKLSALEAEHEAEIARKLKAIDDIVARVRPLVPAGATSSCDDLYNDFGEPA